MFYPNYFIFILNSWHFSGRTAFTKNITKKKIFFNSSRFQISFQYKFSVFHIKESKRKYSISSAKPGVLFLS